VSINERAIRKFPGDAEHKVEISEKLDFVRAVDEGIDQAKAGKIVSAEEVRKRLFTAPK
jgi:hypothetical protein